MLLPLASHSGEQQYSPDLHITFKLTHRILYGKIQATMPWGKKSNILGNSWFLLLMAVKLVFRVVLIGIVLLCTKYKRWVREGRSHLESSYGPRYQMRSFSSFIICHCCRNYLVLLVTFQWYQTWDSEEMICLSAGVWNQAGLVTRTPLPLLYCTFGQIGKCIKCIKKYWIFRYLLHIGHLCFFAKIILESV